MISRKIIINGEGNSIMGSGHIARSLGIALELANNHPHEFEISYCTSNEITCRKLLKDWDFYKHIPKCLFFQTYLSEDWKESSTQILKNLLDISREFNEEILIIDGKSHWTIDEWSKLKERFDQVISIDNLNAIDCQLDAVIFPTNYFIIPSNTRHPENIVSGPSWQWLNPTLQKITQPTNKKFKYSIFMGGADPHNLTLLALQDIFNLSNKSDEILVILGPLYEHENTLIKFSTEKLVKITKASSRYLADLIQAEFTLCAFGLSSIELSFLEQPTILYSHNQEHLRDTENYIAANPNDSITRAQWVKNISPKIPERKKFPNITSKIILLIDSIKNRKSNEK